ncbi:N-acetylglucosaminyldiphosphoundecaprenol N-acetyl-beta-D-mannosaminyltransferase [Caloranaerobacter azorensis DSM 13643]|uniref:N-acetylglucosaminyldiphosphoundecaprenol N-acetyl-beta-D-mannosaminyltransferase n=1 Tax=Caloranaerobacter azorensis DSM 13643 TaxID=1121264 RepID=A0A1M5TKE8_9FIRM|nr:WecB/TagA/CpsF family glycosyltransferase [Caloranaerobacter azorensis]SHH51158.1 N-acetylglucosaminyldiphosphoundecaprenol N-acetyl-beta-D-mannosaminyltransferase [Caloranaerobacter azorensis DSM 13643]
MKDTIKIMGIRINKVTLDSAVDKVHEFVNNGKTNVIYTPNTEIVMAARKDDELRNLLNEGDLNLPDGIGLVYASKIKKKPLKERVTGYDISIKIIEIANKEGLSLFLLGGRQGVALKACENIKEKYSNVKIAGFHHGYFKGTHTGYEGHREEMEVIKKINDAKPDILFVGFGAPRQEKWIHANKDKLNCKVIIGNGGTLDVLAGNVKRAPEIFQRLGLEWLYRLLKEPWRFKRQMVLPLFAILVLFSKDDVVE